MEINTTGTKSYVTGYHTQEFREMEQSLDRPILCYNKAWLGIGYYFWTSIDYAHFWGIDKKTNTGFYDIYSANIDITNFLDTSFSLEGYNFYVQKIQEAIEHFKKNGKQYTYDSINRFLADNIWNYIGINGIIYDDKPINSERRVHSEIPDLYYKKRIQLVSFTLDTIYNFQLISEENPIQTQ